MVSKYKIVAMATLITLSSLLVSMDIAKASTTNKPLCAVLKFSNNTRFKRTDADAVLSDFVAEKMVASGQFQLCESKALTAETEALLYDENARMKQGMREVMNGGNYSTLFEGPGFNSREAYSVDTAKQGQVVSPNIIKRIGESQHVDYLVQGTIDYIGTSKESDESTEKSIMTVRCTLRFIQASTGKVIWSKEVEDKDTNTKMNISFFSIGSSKLDMNMYSKVLDKVAKKIVDKLVTDLNAGVLLADA